MARGLEPGDRVRVREDYPMGHIRTPVYIRGKEGVVVKTLGRFPNPELLALGRDGKPEKTLYEIRFMQAELWPNYNGPETDTLLIDLYEHWLSKI